MVVCVGCDIIGGQLNFFDSNSLKFEHASIPKIGCRDIGSIDTVFINVKNIVLNSIDYFCLVIDEAYKNEFCKKFIEIGKKNGIQDISIIGIHQALFLNAVKEIPNSKTLGRILWIFTLSKNHIYCVIWKQGENNEWKFIENQREQKGLGKNSTITALQSLKHRINYHPNFIMIYDKNLKLRNVQLPAKKISPPENILDVDHESIKSIFPNCDEIWFQMDWKWSEWALINARSSSQNLKYKYDILLERHIQIKIDKIVLFNVPKCQCLPFTKNYFHMESGESNKLMVFEDDFHVQNIEVKVHKDIIVKFKIDLNGVYSINLTYVNEDSKNFVNSEFASENKIQKTTFLSPSQNFVIPLKRTDYNPNIEAIGIDLGTTECCAAVIRKNGPDFVVLDQTTNNRTMPSYVAFDEEKPKCGKIVVDRMRHKSEYTVYDSKRIIGKDFEKIATDPLWPFNIFVDADNQVVLEINSFNGKICKKPEEISSILLLHIKETLEQYQGKILTEAVITIPSEFSEQQKEETKKAAETAGWEIIHFLPEPVAAAFAYFSEIDIPSGSNILICDCGGGTVDVCVATLTQTNFKVLTFDGDSLLGGRDFDKVLFNHFYAILKHKYKIDIKKSYKKYVLNQKCQDIKHNLSTTSEDCLCVDDFLCENTGLISITQEEFNDLSLPLIFRIKNVIFNAISKSKLNRNEINYVFQVGGGCRMPMIKNLLKEIFPNSKHECNLYPDWVVAHGAALYAYHLKANNM